VLDNTSYTDADLKALDAIIDEWRSLFKAAYESSTSMKPKVHYTSHYTDQIRQVGSLINYRCYGMESFHQRIISTWAASNKKNAAFNVLRDHWYQCKFDLLVRSRGTMPEQDKKRMAGAAGHKRAMTGP
jgi:hypothetical protein